MELSPCPGHSWTVRVGLERIRRELIVPSGKSRRAMLEGALPGRYRPTKLASKVLKDAIADVSHPRGLSMSRPGSRPGALLAWLLASRKTEWTFEPRVNFIPHPVSELGETFRLILLRPRRTVFLKTHNPQTL